MPAYIMNQYNYLVAAVVAEVIEMLLLLYYYIMMLFVLPTEFVWQICSCYGRSVPPYIIDRRPADRRQNDFGPALHCI